MSTPDVPGMSLPSFTAPTIETTATTPSEPAIKPVDVAALTPEVPDVAVPAVPSVPEGAASVEGLAMKPDVDVMPGDVEVKLPMKPDVDVTPGDVEVKLPDASVDVPAVQGMCQKNCQRACFKLPWNRNRMQPTKLDCTISPPSSNPCAENRTPEKRDGADLQPSRCP